MFKNFIPILFENVLFTSVLKEGTIISIAAQIHFFQTDF